MDKRGESGLAEGPEDRREPPRPVRAEATTAEVAEIVRAAASRAETVKAVGAGRCPPPPPWRALMLRGHDRPAPLGEVLARLDEHVAGNDHFEFYWMPYTDRTLVRHRSDAHQGQEPHRSDSAPRGRFARWFDQDLLENTVMARYAGLCRAAPSLTPALLRTTARLFLPRVYPERSYVAFTSPRRVRFVEMVLPALFRPG